MDTFLLNDILVIVINDPAADLIFTAGDVRFVVGDAQDIRKVKYLFGSEDNVRADIRTAP